MGSSWSNEGNEEEQQQVQRNMDLQAQSLQPKNLKKPKVTILKEILAEKARLDVALVTENNAILRNFLESFITEMKKNDKIFAQIYQKIFYTGSYYSDLRVSRPDEYDLNLVLKLPFRKENVSIEYHTQVPSYVKYKVTDEKILQNQPSVSKFFKDGYLIPENVRKWMQGVVDKTLTTYRPPSQIAQVRPSAAGPARTIKLIKSRGFDVIDIDLVPVIEFSTSNKPPGIHGLVYLKVKDDLQVSFLVPKPYQTNKQPPVNEKEKERLWRVHYPVAESNLIHRYGCVKPVIKLLKLLRDKENWKILASYYLKTIVMWMVFEHPEREYWTEDKLGNRFMDALNELVDCMDKRKICYFFSSKYNLIQKIPEAQAFNLHRRLCGIIKEIERDNWSLWSIFNCKPTFELVSN